MSDVSSNAPSDHSDDSFDIVPDDTNSGRLVHAPTPSGMDRVVDKLVEVLGKTTEVLAQNQVMLGNMAHMLEIVFKDKRQHRLEAPSKENDAMDRRMAELTEELGCKCAAVESLEKAAKDSHYESRLLDDREQEKDRQIAVMSRRIQELEQLQETSSRDAALKIGELETIIQEERANVGAMKKLVEARDQELAALSQKVHELQSKLKALSAKEQVGAELQKVCGRTVSLRAYSEYFICGNYDNKPATVTGMDATWEFVRFTVENAGNGKVALNSCGNYLTIMEDGSAVNCCRARNKWSHFEWVERDSGEVSLRGANGKYVSSEYGSRDEYVTCNRDEVGPLERFTAVLKNH